MLKNAQKYIIKNLNSLFEKLSNKGDHIFYYLTYETVQGYLWAFFVISYTDLFFCENLPLVTKSSNRYPCIESIETVVFDSKTIVNISIMSWKPFKMARDPFEHTRTTSGYHTLRFIIRNLDFHVFSSFFHDF